jgi:CheY-like chemotaxis protein
MTGLITTENRFSFQVGELTAQLAEHLRSDQLGNWRFQFDRLAKRDPSFYWYVGVADGRLLHSGSGDWSAATLLKTMRRYSKRLQQEEFQARLKLLKELAKQSSFSPVALMEQLAKDRLVSDRQLQQFLQTKILSDFDQYAKFSPGTAEFVPNDQLLKPESLTGFDIQEVLAQVETRQAQWNTIKRQVPSLDWIPTLSSRTDESPDLLATQQAKVADLLQEGDSVNQIAQKLAKDHLDVAQMFANLARAGVVTLIDPRSTDISTVMVIDDSALMLTQFKSWLKPTAYKVLTCQEASHAITMIKKNRPVAIFIDINMPVISGFDLVKQIRSIPEIADIPIAILTGEQKLSNQWQAKWSGCEFLTKPLTANEQNNFGAVLQELILRLIDSETITPTQIQI